MSTVDLATQSLVARTVRRDPRLSSGHDLLDAFEPAPSDTGGFVWLRDGVGFVTGGVAARVPADAVDECLRAIEVRDDVELPGTGAIAVGSLPFLHAASATLTIPAWIEGRAADGSTWRTDIGPDDHTVRNVPEPTVESCDRSGPGQTHSEDITALDHWCAAIDAVLAAIDAGHLAKAVLARTVRVQAERRIDPIWLLRRLAAREPGRFLFATDRIIGASPELLIRRAGTAITSRPLAGSVPLTQDAHALEALTRSAKDRHEHRLVVDAIVSELTSSCARVEVGATTAVPLADVAHLATTIRATAEAGTPSALSLALALHPTPAVGGAPAAAALEHIARWEPEGRGHYAGPVGWVDARGDGEIAVGLRSAELIGTDGRTALVRAGAGIVTGSEPEAEWTEVDAKLTPVLRALTTS